jgi:hypothetical protein
MMKDEQEYNRMTARLPDLDMTDRLTHNGARVGLILRETLRECRSTPVPVSMQSMVGSTGTNSHVQLQ